MGFTCHISGTFTKSRISQRDCRISTIQQLIYGLTLLQTCKCSVLPEDRCHIGRSALQTVMTAHQCLFTECHPLIKDLPELIRITTGRTCDIHKIYGDNALIKTTVIFWLVIFIYIRSQERPASHTWITVSFSVFINLKLQHFLFGNIIRHHSLGSTFCCQLCEIPVLTSLGYIVLLQNIDQLRKCRCNINTFFIFDTKNPLAQDFLCHKCEIIPHLSLRHLVQIHKNSDKRCLTIGSHQCDHLILDHLYTFFDLI